MLKRQKEIMQYQLDNEKAVLNELEKQYKRALADINEKIKLLQSDELTQSRIYHIQYQKVLKKQVAAALEKLHSDEYSTIQQYLSSCYTDAFIGTMYDMHGQGVPVIVPIDQDAAVKAVMTDSKLNKDLYEELGIDVNALKKTVSAEISRGIATGLMYGDIARNIANASGIPLKRAKTIARTDGHRIQEASAEDARQLAKSRGADVVKQWDSTLDGDTRATHRRLDGQIRETDENFEMDGKEAPYPGEFGDPAEDCNCRCRANTIARWMLDDDELDRQKERANYWGLDKSKDFSDFKKKYQKAAQTVEKPGKSGIIERGKTSGQSKQRAKATDDIIKRGIEMKRPIYAADGFGQYIAHTQPEEGFYDVALHGTPILVEFFGQEISSQTLAKIIKGRKDYSGGAVRLLSCETGNTSDSENCFAQRLADSLGVDVKAPNKTLWVYPDGRTTVGTDAFSHDGDFVIFKPRKER